MTGAPAPPLDGLLAPAGWPYASSPPVDRTDPGRYHALFGRDALITALQVLPARPEVARAALRALAALQGHRDDPALDEEPGKIPHEHWSEPPRHVFEALRFEPRPGPLVHYSSADGTAWFLVVLASVGDAGLARELEPAWRAAGGWLERALERGDGLVRHGPRRAPGGLSQQGWRDSADPAGPGGNGIARPDGSPPRQPLADADTQAVAAVALRALALLSGEARHRRAARAMASRVEEAFGPETMALEPGDVPVPGAGSQLGWLLWSGALSRAAERRLADRLVRPDVLTAHGLRTLSDLHPCFAADAYHRGSVWPFDSWLGWGGLRAGGRRAEAERVRRGVAAAIARLGGAPELYAVEADGPRRIALANRVQAWTAGAAWALAAGWDGRSPALFA